MSALPALPSNLPNIDRARLPVAYEGAKTALTECTRIDECQDWADKAEALASYAKQAQDDELRKMADRIQARAIQRCGELLQRIAAASGARTDIEPRDGADPRLTRTRAADEAGLSERQRKTALRVARVPYPEFQEAVEADEPATVTELARRGTMPSRVDHLKGRDPNDFRAATALLGLLHHIDRTAAPISLPAAGRGLSEPELGDALTCIDRIQEWLGSVASTLEERINV